MFFEKRKLQEEKILGTQNISYLDTKIQKKISLRSKKNNIKIQIKRTNILEQNQSNFSQIKEEDKFEIYKFESYYHKIIAYLKSSNNNLISYCLHNLCIYFKSNEPSINEQKLIIEGQFFEILLDLGNKFIKENNENDLIKIIWILINVQVYHEGNNDYLKIIYDEKYMEFYYNCFNKSDSDEIMNEIITLLTYMVKNNKEVCMLIIKSKVFESIVKFAKSNYIDLQVVEMVIELIVNCLNISKDYILNENEINIINDCIFILKNEASNIENEKLQKLSYEGLYKISKLDNQYKFNQKMINIGIPFKIIQLKKNNNNILINALKTFGNILTVSDKYCKNIYENNIITYFNDILNKYDDNHKLVKIILENLLNITASKYRDKVKLSIIWNKEKLIKYFNMNDQIKIILIKILKYMIKYANYETLQFIFQTQILEYLIYLLSNFNVNEKVCVKILKVVDIYLKKLKSYEKEKEKKNMEYDIIFNKFTDLFKLSEKFTNNNNKEVIDYIEKNIINNYE